MSVFRKIVKQMLLKCFGNQNRKIIALTKGKWFLTTLIAINKEMKGSTGKRKAMDVINIDLSKYFRMNPLFNE